MNNNNDYIYNVKKRMEQKYKILVNSGIKVYIYKKGSKDVGCGPDSISLAKSLTFRSCSRLICKHSINAW